MRKLGMTVCPRFAAGMSSPGYNHGCGRCGSPAAWSMRIPIEVARPKSKSMQVLRRPPPPMLINPIV